MELNAIALETLSTVKIEGKLLKDYELNEIVEWGLRIGLSVDNIEIYKQTIIELNK